MFSTPSYPAQGVSAVKALQIAVSQGQRVYHITPANQSQTLRNLRLDSLALEEIGAALASGKEVIAHTDRISVPVLLVRDTYLLTRLRARGHTRSPEEIMVAIFRGTIFSPLSLLER